MAECAQSWLFARVRNTQSRGSICSLTDIPFAKVRCVIMRKTRIYFVWQGRARHWRNGWSLLLLLLLRLWTSGSGGIGRDRSMKWFWYWRTRGRGFTVRMTVVGIFLFHARGDVPVDFHVLSEGTWVCVTFVTASNFAVVRLVTRVHVTVLLPVRAVCKSTITSIKLTLERLFTYKIKMTKKLW